MRTAPGVGLVVLLAIIPVARGAAVSLELPGSFRVAESVLVAGAVRSDAAALTDVRFLRVSNATFGEGLLTVCPREARGGTILEALRAAGQGCRGAETFENPRLAFGAGTDLVFQGEHAVTRWPAASTVAFYGEDVTALVASDDGVALAREGDLFRFSAISAGASIAVEVDGEVPRYFNGTQFLFLHEAEETTAAGAGAVGVMPPARFSVSVASREAIAQATDPFLILDLQEAWLGADAREPRANVTALFLEYGRVPAFVNGAVFGRLEGQAGRVALSNGTALIRGALSISREGDRLQGDLDPVVLLTDEGVAFADGGLRRPPWLLIGLVWAGALAVLVVRRQPAPRTRALKALWFGVLPAALAVADLWIFRAHLGTSAVAEASAGASAGSVLALAVSEITLVALAFASIALPLRLATARVSAGRARFVSEAVLAVFWLAALAVLPGAFFALTHAVARI